MSGEPLVVERRGRVSWAAMNRPAALCALDGAQLDRLLAWLRAAAADETVGALCLTGTGRGFSAGADIKEMEGLDEAGAAANTARYQALARACRDLPKPILAAVNGVCLGGGMELACMCDLRIAGASARLGLPDASLGFSVSGGLSWHLPRLVGLGRAWELYLTERVLDAGEARDWGLVAEVVADEALPGRVQAMAERMAAFPRVGVRNMKPLLYRPGPDLDAALDAEERLEAACFADPEVDAMLRAFLDSRRERRRAGPASGPPPSRGRRRPRR